MKAREYVQLPLLFNDPITSPFPFILVDSALISRLTNKVKTFKCVKKQAIEILRTNILFHQIQTISIHFFHFNRISFINLFLCFSPMMNCVSERNGA